MSLIHRLRSTLTSAVKPAVPPAPKKTQAWEPSSKDTFSKQVTNAPLSLTGNAQAAFEVKPDAVSVTGSLNGQFTGPKGISVAVEASATASQRSDVESKDGYTTYTVTTEASFTVSGKVDTPIAGFGAGRTEGVTTTFQVRMSDADFARMENGEIPEPSPFDPSTMPPGSSILTNSEDHTETALSASYRQVSIDSKIKETEGTSVVYEMGEDNQLTVTAGPQEAIENSFKLGFSFGPASVHVGNTTSLEGATLHTATFDLDTEEGTGAYGEFLVTGDMPKENSEGVSGATKIEKLNFDSTSTAGLKVGPFSLSGEIGSNNLSQVRTTLPDGSGTLVSNFNFHPADIPVQLTQVFGPDGEEDVSRQELTLTLEDVNDETGAHLIEAFHGTDYATARAMLDGDKDVVLTLNQEQAESVIAQAQDYVADWEELHGQKWDEVVHTGSERIIGELAQAENVADVALIFTEVNSEGGAAKGLLLLSAGFDPRGEPTPLAGDVSVE